MISKRLKKITNWINNGSVVADIGTDHALLLIELEKQNKLKKGYACDIANGPLNQAEKNVKLNKCEKKIEIILSDGFNNLIKNMDIAVIAGLGQNTIKKILKEGKEKLPGRIIICSNTISNKIRELLSTLKYLILFEEIIYDKNKSYELMVFDLTEGIKIRNYLLGDFNVLNQTIELKKYWKDNLIKFEEILKIKNDKILLNNVETIKENILWN